MKTPLIAMFSLTLFACGSSDGGPDASTTGGTTAGSTTAGTTTGGSTTGSTTAGTTTGGAGTTTGGTSTGTTTGTAACTAATATATTSITIKSFAYSPSCALVNNGAAVTFTNNDSAPHTATTQPGANSAETFDTGTISANGGTAAHTFTVTGTDTVWCKIHQTNMGTMTFVVQ